MTTKKINYIKMLISLTPVLDKDLREFCEMNERKLIEVIREAIRFYLDSH